MNNSALVEGPRRLSQITDYDLQGRKTHEWVSIKDLDPRDQYFVYEEQSGQTLRYLSEKPTPDRKSTSNEYTSVSVFRFDAGENAIYQDVYASATPSPKTLTQKWKFLFDSSGRLIEDSVSACGGKVVIRNI